jgi:hypothetical protein
MSALVESLTIRVVVVVVMPPGYRYLGITRHLFWQVVVVVVVAVAVEVTYGWTMLE